MYNVTTIWEVANVFGFMDAISQKQFWIDLIWRETKYTPVATFFNEAGGGGGGLVLLGNGKCVRETL